MLWGSHLHLHLRSGGGIPSLASTSTRPCCFLPCLPALSAEPEAHAHAAHAASCPACLPSVLSPKQQASICNLLRMRDVLAQNAARLKEERTNEFLSAASRGDIEHIKKVGVGGGP